MSMTRLNCCAGMLDSKKWPWFAGVVPSEGEEGHGRVARAVRTARGT